MILEEFDENKQAVLNAEMIFQKIEGMPKVAVTCYSRVTFARMIHDFGAEEVIAHTSCACMEIPIYKAVYHGVEIALFNSMVGAPSCVAVFEDIYAMGIETIIVFGNCGVLDRTIEDCGIIIPNRAVRDEGTSFHYAPPSDEIDVNPKYKEEFIEILEQVHCNYTIGKTWTTDGVYRETIEKVERRKQAGCICVEMECSADAALAQFRGKELFQFFYAGDNLDAEEWDARSLGAHSEVEKKDRVAILAMDLAAKIMKGNGDKK